MNPEPKPILSREAETAKGRLFDLRALASIKSRPAQLAAALRKDYPVLKPYLVLTRNGQFVNADASPDWMLRDAPALFSDNTAKAAILQILWKKIPRELNKKGDEQKAEKWNRAWQREFRALSTRLVMEPESLFEILFGHLDYGEIQRMQMDPRVDAGRTPRSRASIRIVLGSLAEFASGDGN